MTGAATSRAKRRRLAWLIMLALPALILFIGFVRWLFLPSVNASFAISAQTSALSVEVLCGERLVWDLPKGRVGPRSALPGTSAEEVGNVTLALTAGARARLESTNPKMLHVSIEAVPKDSIDCDIASPPYQATLGEKRLADDPLGFRYAAAGPTEGENPAPVSLPLAGHVVLGQPVQHGAGWGAPGSGLLEGGTVALRVVPWGSDQRVTLDTEQLDPGSLLDSHACLTQAGESDSLRCPLRGEPPAIGFLRSLPGGGLSVQLYSRGPVGLLPFGSGEPRTLRVPNSTAGWRSERVHVIGGFIAFLVGLLLLIPTLKKEVVDPLLNWYLGRTTSEAARTNGYLQIAELQELIAKLGALLASMRQGTKSVSLFALLAGLACALEATPAVADPVEIRQGTLVGAGYSFKRGNTCHVVTALHVVPEIGVPVTVLDRTGAKTEGSRSYKNESYDLALITLPDNHTVACSATWPEAGWLRGANFSAAREFRAIRHYSGGREVIIRLKHAGGDRDRLTLAPVDKLVVRESDSGAMVELDGKLAGIVQSIDTATDYVSVLRFDRIDELVGDRFRGTASARLIKFAGVTWHGRENPTWSSYVQAWIAEKVGPTVTASSPSPGGAAKYNCEIKVEVVSWDRVAVPNPAYDSVQMQLKACGKKGFLYEQLCSAARSASAGTPRQLQSQKITLNAIVTPAGATPLSKLTTSTHVPQSGTLSRTDIELGSLQAAVGLTLPDMLAGGACN